MNEIWRSIPGYEGIYEASSEGRVRLLVARRGFRAGHLLSPIRMKGYFHVRLRDSAGKRHSIPLHRLILETFTPCPHGGRLIVLHDNGRPEENHLANLLWCTHDEACLRRPDLYRRGESVPVSKLTAEAVREIRRLSAEGFAQTEIAPRFGVAQITVSRVLRGLVWKHIA